MRPVDTHSLCSRTQAGINYFLFPSCDCIFLKKVISVHSTSGAKHVVTNNHFRLGLHELVFEMRMLQTGMKFALTTRMCLLFLPHCWVEIERTTYIFCRAASIHSISHHLILMKVLELPWPIFFQNDSVPLQESSVFQKKENDSVQVKHYMHWIVCTCILSLPVYNTWSGIYCSTPYIFCIPNFKYVSPKYCTYEAGKNIWCRYSWNL